VIISGSRQLSVLDTKHVSIIRSYLYRGSETGRKVFSQMTQVVPWPSSMAGETGCKTVERGCKPRSRNRAVRQTIAPSLMPCAQARDPANAAQSTCSLKFTENCACCTARRICRL
jgi:hypothetical protein